MSTVQEKIDGLIALMQRGVYEGERTQAHKALLRLCAKNNINFDDLLNKDKEPEMYLVKHKNAEEAGVFAPVCFRYGDPVYVGRYRGNLTVAVECLPIKYMEIMAAWSVLKHSWREEKEVFKIAFFKSNGLLGKRTKDTPEPTPEEEALANRAAAMAMFVKPSELRKQLSA